MQLHTVQNHIQKPHYHLPSFLPLHYLLAYPVGGLLSSLANSLGGVGVGGVEDATPILPAMQQDVD